MKKLVLSLTFFDKNIYLCMMKRVPFNNGKLSGADPKTYN